MSWMVYLCESDCPSPVVCGLYLATQSSPFDVSWEYLTALDYEWDVIRGKRPYRWTIWVCSLCFTLYYVEYHNQGLNFTC